MLKKGANLGAYSFSPDDMMREVMGRMYRQSQFEASVLCCKLWMVVEEVGDSGCLCRGVICQAGTEEPLKSIWLMNAATQSNFVKGLILPTKV